jgi:hypothetical protein
MTYHLLKIDTTTYPLCFIASYNTTPALTDTLSDSVVPAMGMRIFRLL